MADTVRREKKTHFVANVSYGRQEIHSENNASAPASTESETSEESTKSGRGRILFSFLWGEERAVAGTGYGMALAH